MTRNDHLLRQPISVLRILHCYGLFTNSPPGNIIALSLPSLNPSFLNMPQLVWVPDKVYHLELCIAPQRELSHLWAAGTGCWQASPCPSAFSHTSHLCAVVAEGGEVGRMEAGNMVLVTSWWRKQDPAFLIPTFTFTAYLLSTEELYACWVYDRHRVKYLRDTGWRWHCMAETPLGKIWQNHSRSEGMSWLNTA